MRVPSSQRRRGQYVGGPSACAIYGVNPWANAADVYAQLVFGFAPETSKRMQRGLRAEAGVIDWLRREKGLILETDVHVIDDANPRKGCSIDAIDSTGRIHSIKSTRSTDPTKWGAPGTDQADTYALHQWQWERSLVPDAPDEGTIWLEDMETDDQPAEFFARRDPEIAGLMHEAVDRFLCDHVDKRLPPLEPAKDADARRSMWPIPRRTPKGKGAPIEPNDAIRAAAWTHHVARTVAEQATKAADAAETNLRLLMGDAGSCKWTAEPERGIHAGSVSLWSRRLDDDVNWDNQSHDFANWLNANPNSTPQQRREAFHHFQKKNSKSGRWSTPTLKVTIKETEK